MKSDDKNSAGFWIRIIATWIDLILVYCILLIIKLPILLFKINIYLPEEFIFLILFIIYSTIAIIIKGYTVGKWLLYLRVVNENNYERLSIFKSIFRESILKPLSGLLLFIGFLWIAFSKRKNGLHDKIVRSKITRINYKQHRKNIWMILGICSLTLFFGWHIYKTSNIIYTGKKMELPRSTFDLPFVKRNQGDIIDISTINSDTMLINWLKQNSLSPEEYAISTAASHKLTLFGETHGVKDNLDFLNRIIPDLYFKSGIRCIGMECIPSSMNKEVSKLVNGKTFNRQLELKIARSQPWKIWGMKEYWDVLETVWKLNQELPENLPKMRVVGIDENWDGPKLALILPTSSDDGLKKVPVWEKLKIFTSIDDLVKLAYRDELMARNVEKEIIEKGDKGIIWIGSAHIPLQYGNPIIYDNKVLFVKGRFGLILNQRHKDEIGQILLWHSLSDKNNEEKSLNNLLESVISSSDTTPVGFKIEGSPFGKLRDNQAKYFNKYKTICLEDIYQGLIFLQPLNNLKPCTWDIEYISQEMFNRYKLFYNLKSRQQLSNCIESNIYFLNASKEEGFTDN